MDCHESLRNSRNDEVEGTLLFAKAKRSKNFIKDFLFDFFTRFCNSAESVFKSNSSICGGSFVFGGNFGVATRLLVCCSPKFPPSAKGAPKDEFPTIYTLFRLGCIKYAR